MTEHSVIEIWQKSAWKSALFCFCAVADKARRKYSIRCDNKKMKKGKKSEPAVRKKYLNNRRANK